MPAMLRSFQVPTGFPSKENDGDAALLRDETPASATIGAAGLAGRPGPGSAAYGQVDLEIERRILSNRTQSSLLNFKRASPVQFTELKHRLAEGVKSAQQVAEQLQRCANTFDPKVRKEKRQEKVGKFLTWQKALAGLLLAVLPVLAQLDWPSLLHEVLDPLVEMAPELPEQLKPYTSWVYRMVVLNLIVVVGVFAMFINSLKMPGVAGVKQLPVESLEK